MRSVRQGKFGEATSRGEGMSGRSALDDVFGVYDMAWRTGVGQDNDDDEEGMACQN